MTNYSPAGCGVSRWLKCSICRGTKSTRSSRSATRPAPLYEDAVILEHAAIADSGALIIGSGKKTGRSPLDKRIVDHPDSSGSVWWGPVNIKLDEQVFVINRQRAIDYLNTREQLYVVDGYAGWDPRYRIKVRVICAALTTRCSCATC